MSKIANGQHVHYRAFRCVTGDNRVSPSAFSEVTWKTETTDWRRQEDRVDKSFTPNAIEMAYPVPQVLSRPGKMQDHISPFCSLYFVFLFSGVFISPLFLIGGMFGVYSDKPHEFLAGKASAVACMLYTVIFVIAGAIMPFWSDEKTVTEEG